ncbi:hypothetical protein PhaeoP78_00860 [Phaeobacter inhibens]|nr:hypothetical protein PhaeoP78_00860 [Phaeobacter inhibens]
MTGGNDCSHTLSPPTPIAQAQPGQWLRAEGQE